MGYMITSLSKQPRLGKRKKVTLFHGGFSRFLNCPNGSKSCRASEMFLKITIQCMWLYCWCFIVVLELLPCLCKLK